MNNKVWVGVTAVCVTIIVILLMFLFGKEKIGIENGKYQHNQEENTQNVSATNDRENILKIIRIYMNKGEFDRALDQIDVLLRQNIDDAEVLELQDMVINMKNEQKEKELKEAQKQQRNNYYPQNDTPYENMNTVIERRDEMPMIISRGNAEKQEQDIAQKEIDDLLNKGLKEYNTQNYTRARSILNDVLEKDKENPEANAALAATLLDENPDDTKNLEEAVKRAQQALKKDPNQETARLVLGKIYAKRGMSEQAIDEYKRLLQINPNSYELFYELGKQYFKSKQYEKAIEAFISATNIKPDFIHGYFYQGLSYYKNEEIKEAITVYTKVLDMDPEFYEANANLGEIYRLDGDANNAIKYFKKAVSINNKASLQKRLGDCYKDLKKYQEALECYNKSISINKQESSQEKNYAVSCYNEMADIRILQEKYSEAKKLALKGLEIIPDNANLHFIAAFASEKDNDSASAIDEYLKAIELNPTFTTAYINVSALYNAIGEPQNAVDILKRGLEHDATNYKLLNNLGNALQKLEFYEEAIKNYKKAISLNNDISDLHLNLGLCYKSVNNQKEAIKSFTKAAELSPSSEEIQYELAESYFQLQDYENAEKLLLYLNNNSQSNKKAKIDEMLNAIKAQKEAAADEAEKQNDENDLTTDNITVTY